MNHYTAFQPPRLDGKWQYAMLDSRGGGPICGCDLTEGHDTREEAERHYWETAITGAYIHSWDDDNEQRRCEVCQEWTTHRVVVRVGSLHDDVHVLCPDHGIDPASLVPFRPGLESWGTM